MKNLFRVILALNFLVIILFQSIIQGQTSPSDPRFTMTVRNITLTNNIGFQDSILQFEIWMQQINQGQPGVHDLEYAAGQFTWSYNKAVRGDGNLFLNLYGPGCALPPTLRPPSFQVDTANGYLKMSGNLPHSTENFFIIGTFPGTRILTGRLRTSLNEFPHVFLQLRFKLGANPNTFVAYFQPYPDSVDSEQFPSQNVVALMDTINPEPQETPVYNVEEPFCLRCFLPVEMSVFSSGVNENTVTLNWTTATESNNQGFDIQRQDAGSETEDVWVKAGYVAGNGNSTVTKSYAFSERLNTGRYKYRLKQIDFNGGVNFHELRNEVSVGIPNVYSLLQNYPNPFNPTTKIDFELPHDGKVSISLYDISGREVVKLVNEVRTAGYHTVEFNGSNLSSGMYFYRINAEGGGQNFAAVKKLVLIK
ncbi:MAG: T9SS type A sorting domain-containing protein [Ignavibacteria bacterium]|nr:T9SS type A sorting domain-containing protein [Ignavibacteria bacterium]